MLPDVNPSKANREIFEDEGFFGASPDSMIGAILLEVACDIVSNGGWKVVLPDLLPAEDSGTFLSDFAKLPVAPNFLLR